jgi:hypothetical protein
VTRTSKYSLRHIRQNYTQTVAEIAEMFSLTPDTVFRWIRNEGLNRIPGSKKYLVHTSDLRNFLTKKNAKNKRPCKEGEIFCCKCRMPQKPDPAFIKIKRKANKTVQVKGKCSVCGTNMMTFVSGTKWSQNHPFHPSRNAPTEQHNGADETPRECQTKVAEQLCLNITL